MNTQAVRIERGGLALSGCFWQRDSDGYVATLEGKGGPLDLAGGLSAARPDLSSAVLWQGRLQGSIGGGRGTGSGLQAGLALYGQTDSTTLAEGHLLGRLSLRPELRIVCRCDVRGAPPGMQGADLDPAWTLGLCFAPPEETFLRPAAGVALVSPGRDGKRYLMARLSVDRVSLCIEAEPDGWATRAGATLVLDRWVRGGLSYVDDTLGLSGVLLPSFRYGNARVAVGAAGRLEMPVGGRDAAGAGSEPSGSLELLSMFELGAFSFVLAAEDVTDDAERSYTYGIVWSFDDGPRGFGLSDEGDR